ncbi:hypothetical protein L596_006455 [Steinernema carpocapsae]|uniref:PAX-interacting protein 1 n=1 Tax=Steinernema carpocapsae TaxID=34508 RepID=A0A4U8V451_STECR|nr:hypothetical protein L596_006455 [Steinernema carpocapsae]
MSALETSAVAATTEVDKLTAKAALVSAAGVPLQEQPLNLTMQAYQSQVRSMAKDVGSKKNKSGRKEPEDEKELKALDKGVEAALVEAVRTFLAADFGKSKKEPDAETLNTAATQESPKADVDGRKSSAESRSSDEDQDSSPLDLAQTVPVSNAAKRRSSFKVDSLLEKKLKQNIDLEAPPNTSAPSPSFESQSPDTVAEEALRRQLMTSLQSLFVHSLYPSGSVTPAQPTGFNPRFGPPVQGISPQYPNANDLRSPGLMSPNQSMRIPCMPGDPLVPNMMRVATQSSHFFGHDHQFSMPLDMCLMGCNFYLVENERSLYDKHDLANLSAVIKYHGGDLKWGNQGWNERTTHVLCESYQHPYVRNVLKEGRKRCVTLQWLNEVLIRKRMEAPWKFCHLPSFWNDVRRPAPGTSKTIAVSGYHEIELINVKMMISAIGARFTPHLSVENDFLISKGECLQVERARELGVRVLNYRWLQDAYTGLYNNTNNSNVYPDHENPLYILGSPEPCPEVTSTPYMMERYNDIYNKLLAPWKFPIVVNHEIFNVGMELRKSIENDENTFPYKKVKNLTPPPTDEQIVEARKVLKELAEPLPKVVICLSGMLPDDQKNLAKKAEFLGAQITTDVEKCTHFVCVSLFRTVDLMKAIALPSHNFIVYGYTILRFPDTYDLYLSDDENEKNYGYSLKNSIWRARKQPIFEDITFYVMPSVHPSRKILCDLIITAGGVVDDERPAPKYLAECVEYERPYFVIGCDADLHLYHYLVDCKFLQFFEHKRKR